MTLRRLKLPPLLAGCALLGAALLLAGRAGEGAWPPWYKPSTKPPVYPEVLVSARWLAERSGDRRVTLIDARPGASFRAGHLPGARSFDPYAAPADPGSLVEHFGRAGIPSAGTLVCYSDRDHPASAGRLFWLLELAGCRNARVLNGGLEAWRGTGGPVASGDAPARPAAFVARADTSRWADFAHVMAAFGRAGHTIMDWRSPAAWSRGHIPHSLPFPLRDLVQASGEALPGPEMRPVFAEFGPRPREYASLGDEFVVCGDAAPDSAPIHPYLAARLAGIARVRCYAEGFGGWKRHAGAPVVRIVDAAEVAAHLGPLWWRKLTRTPPGDAILLDVRGDRDYRTGHLPGAVSLPPDRIEKELEATVARLWPKADRARIPVIFYCYGPGCTRSRNCSTIAAQHGFRNLLWFKDGVEGWQAADHTLVPGG